VSSKQVETRDEVFERLANQFVRGFVELLAMSVSSASAVEWRPKRP
jgi:hypothetical protein